MLRVLPPQDSPGRREETQGPTLTTYTSNHCSSHYSAILHNVSKVRVFIINELFLTAMKATCFRKHVLANQGSVIKFYILATQFGENFRKSRA